MARFLQTLQRGHRAPGDLLRAMSHAHRKGAFARTIDDFDRSTRARPDSDAPQARSPGATNSATNQKHDPHKSLYFQQVTQLFKAGIAALRGATKSLISLIFLAFERSSLARVATNGATNRPFESRRQLDPRVGARQLTALTPRGSKDCLC